MANPNLFIYKLMNNVNSQVLINGLSKEIIAYTTQDLSFSLSAQWSGRNPNSYMNLANTMEQLGTELYNRVAGKRFGEITTGMTLDVAGSLLNYQGTENFGFTLPLYFIATKPDDDVRQRVGYLAEGVCPIFGKGGGGLGRIYSPNNYKKGSNVNDISGAVSIRIGKWFRTPKIFVIDNIDPNFSQVTIPSGLPLYAQVSVKFRSARILSITEVKTMFGLK